LKCGDRKEGGMMFWILAGLTITTMLIYILAICKVAGDADERAGYK